MSWRFSLRAALFLVLICLSFGAEVWAAEKSFSRTPMTLAECLQEALENSPNLSAETARSEAAEYQADAARAARFPRLDLAADYSYSERGQRLIQPSYQGEVIRFENDIAQVLADIRVPLFSGGRLVARQRAAELAAAAGRFNLRGSRQDMILNVTTAYLAAVEQQSVLEAIDASLNALREHKRIAEAMKEVGRIAPLDLLKVEVRLAAVEQRRSKAERDRELIALHLAVLMGRELGASLPVAAGSPELPRQEIPDQKQLAEEAVAARPEIAALRQEIARRRAELAQVWAERWPSVEAFGRWTMRTAVPATSAALPPTQSYFGGGLTLKVPVWTGGDWEARRNQARALLKEAQERERAARLRIMEQAQREAAALAEATERFRVADKAALQAWEAFEIERANYELGRATVNDVLDAQAALLESELALAQARHDVAYATVASAWAAGRDLEKMLKAGKDEMP